MLVMVALALALALALTQASASTSASASPRRVVEPRVESTPRPRRLHVELVKPHEPDALALALRGADLEPRGRAPPMRSARSAL